MNQYTPDAARVLRLLAAGKTTRQVADMVSWPRERVVALARAQKGWILSAETDTVTDPGSVDGTIRLPDGVSRAERLTYETALTKAEASNSPRLRRLAARARPILDELMDRLVSEHQAGLLAQEVDELQRALAEKQARIRELTGRKTPASRPASPTSTVDGGKERRAAIRAWAASQGEDCPKTGRIPKDIVKAYDEAHGGDSDG